MSAQAFRRGDSTRGPVEIQPEHDESGLVWWRCAFCARLVLVDAWRRTRERCECGAVRCHHTRDGRWKEGWRKDGEEWWYI